MRRFENGMLLATVITIRLDTFLFLKCCTIYLFVKNSLHGFENGILLATVITIRLDT